MNNTPTLINPEFMNKEVQKEIGQTIARDCSPIELEAFCRMCAMTGLNPLMKEAYAIKYQGRMSFVVSLAGYLKFANAHAQYDGYELYYGTMKKQDGVESPEYVECKVYRKDRSRPTTFRAYWSEFNKGQALWKTMPSLMLAKCAESGAHRKAFVSELGSTHTFEEMPEDITVTASDPEPVPEVKLEPKKAETLKENEDGSKTYKMKPKAPEPFEAEVQEVWKYDLSSVKMIDEKYDKIVEYLDDFTNWEMKDGNQLISIEELPKLKNYEVK